MSNDKIIITEQQLNHFLEEFSEAEWMDSFRKDFLPFIQTHKVPCYSFSENKILAYTLSELNESSRLEMLQALKTKSEAPISSPVKIQKICMNYSINDDTIYTNPCFMYIFHPTTPY